MESTEAEQQHQRTRSDSEEEEDDTVFDEQGPKPALRRPKNQNGEGRKRPANRIKSWYIKGPTVGPQTTDTSSAVPVLPFGDLRQLAQELGNELLDWDTAFLRSVCASPDGNRIYFLLSDVSSLFRYCDNKLQQRELRLTDLSDKRLQPRHLSVDEAAHLIFISGEVDTDDNEVKANVLARFRLPSEDAWTGDSEDKTCKYLGRTKLFNNQEKFGCIVHQSFKRVIASQEVKEAEEDDGEQKENKVNETKEETTEDDNGLWIASPQASPNVYEKTQIFKLTTDFKHKPCTVSLGRQGVVYLPKHLSIDEEGWAYVGVDRVESGPQGSTKLWSSRLLTFPTRPPPEMGSNEHTRDWMRVNSWQFQGITPGATVSLIPGHTAVVFDRERGKLHKVTWYGNAIQGQGSAECNPVHVKHALGLGNLPEAFDGIAAMGPKRIILYKGTELFEMQVDDLK